MAAKEIAVKKYVVKLSAEERVRLDSVIDSGKHPAQRLMKARILLKADGEAGEAWSDSQIANALDTSLATIARTRQQVVEEGFDAAHPQAFAGLGKNPASSMAPPKPSLSHSPVDPQKAAHDGR